MLSNISLKTTYAMVGGELATPIREFLDDGGTAWLEAIFVSGHTQTLERYPKRAFLSLVLQEVW